MRFLALLPYFLFLVLLPCVQGQEFVKGEIIVQLGANFNASDFEKESAARGLSLKMQNPLFPEKKIFLYAFDSKAIAHEVVLNTVRTLKSCLYVQNNHLLTSRTTPNDPYFNQQWQYINAGGNGGLANADLDMDLAWDISTGGITALGDTIVVCVIDDGIDTLHEDLRQNLWKNKGEIPNNGIDDDGNGYIDDIYGWNTISDNANIQGGGHGTSVAAIIGAEGDNNIGVSGINWQIKLMIVKGGGNEAQAISAYRYPYIMRKKYNESAGLYGAFVVVTNASWGVIFLPASQAPIWCALYDDLGSEGILSIAATSNLSINVEERGDMPTTCTSPYLLTVTNINRQDQLEIDAAFGAQSIDIGAYGSEAFTAKNGNTYGTFGGTSSAAPHVAGVAALLYATPCLGLAYEAQMQASTTALNIKNMIMQGGSFNASLQNKTLSGKRLNAWGAMQLAMAYDCDLPLCHTPFNIKTTLEANNTLLLTWSAAANAPNYTLRFGIDSTQLQTFTTVDTFLRLDNLSPCQNYIFQIAYICSIDNQSYSSNFFQVQTQNCCYAPSQILQVQSHENTLEITWANSAEIENTTIFYKRGIDSNWDSVNTNQSQITLSNLIACSSYEIKFKTHCLAQGLENESQIFALHTTGCGACWDNLYCDGHAQNSNYEWISHIQLPNFSHQSNNSPTGYSDEGINLSPTLNIRYPIAFNFTLSQHLSTPNWSWWVWIDLNQDGVFDSPTELIYNSGSVTQESHSGFLSIPSTALLGNTRMRIAMRWNDIALQACSIFPYGEVEDYCVILENRVSSTETQNTDLPILVYPNPFEEKINILIENPSTNEKIQLYLHDILGRRVYEGIIEKGENTHSIDTENLAKGAYMLSLEREYGIIFSKKLIK